MKSSFPPDAPYIDHEDLPTLTEMKEHGHAMKALGKQIVELTDKQLRRVPLQGQLREAIMEARRLPTYAARKRQLGFIGRLLRTHDVAPLQKALDDMAASVPYVDPQVQLARDWTGRIIAEGHAAIQAFLDIAPGAERTRLSQLLRQYSKDVKPLVPVQVQEEQDTAAAAREASARVSLMRYVREELAAARE